MRTKLPILTWGYAILDVASLICIRLTSNHKFSLLQLAFCQELNISHLRIFGYAVFVLITPSQRKKMGPKKRLGICVGYKSLSIIKYLKPLIDDLFTAWFVDCHFDKSIFPTLGGDNKQLDKDKEITWNTLLLYHLDPCTK